MAKLKKEFNQVDENYHEEVIERDRELLEVPFSHEIEVDLRPELNIYNYDH